MAKMTIDNVTYEGTPEELRDIVRMFETDVEDAKTPEYKTEKREAKVGERILIVGAMQTNGYYSDGDVRTVALTMSAGVLVEEHSSGLFHREYEVIVDDAETAVETPTVYPEEGDIVRVVSDELNHRFNVGDIGIVKIADKSHYPLIEVPGHLNGKYALVEIVARAKDRVDTE